MSIKPDRWIREMCLKHRMITPFEDKQVREGVISYGLSSYGYDIRIADEFKIFTNAPCCRGAIAVAPLVAHAPITPRAPRRDRSTRSDARTVSDNRRRPDDKRGTPQGG